MSDCVAKECSVSVTEFGALPDGTQAHCWSLSNDVLEARFTDYGARLVSLKTPDREGRLAEVVLGHDLVGAYIADRKTYMGATIGRYANRIANGAFSLDDQTYRVPVNDGENALHGGPEGFDRQVWRGRTSESSVIFERESVDGEMGFPGALSMSVTFTLAGRSLRIDYAALSPGVGGKATVVNLTNHAYFNLAGPESETVLGHEVMIAGDGFTPVDQRLIPTGELVAVKGSPFDFLAARQIGDRIDEVDEQLGYGKGYDHNWVLGSPGVIKVAARVTEPISGRVLTVETTEAGMQFYTGNFLDGSVPKRDGNGGFGHRSGFCLETQGFPDAPNQPQFPSTVLRAGETRKSTTVFSFSAAD